MVHKTKNKHMSQIGIQHSFDLGDGRIVTLETGKLAKQADGAVVVKLGSTMILATVVSNKEAKEGVFKRNRQKSLGNSLASLLKKAK